MTSTTPDGPGESPPIAERYELLEVLGRGGDSVVHRGWDRRLQREVALKLVPTRGTGVEAGREARLLAGLHHDRLVALLDAVVEPHRLVLVMDLVQGGTLQRAIADGPVDPAEVAAFAADLADALAYTHARGVVHRDVKPANVLLSEPAARGGHRQAHLADFGIARLLGTDTSRSADLIGTARYVSPEQARGLQVGPPTDVYSLGLTLLEALSGRPAFPGGTAEALTARLLRDPDVPPSVGHAWRALLSEMTRRDPASRPTAAEVALRVRTMPAAAVERPWTDATATMPIAVLTAPFEVPVIPTGVRAGRRPAVLVGAVAALLLVAGAGALATAVAPSASQPAAAEAAPSSTPEAAPSARAASAVPDPQPSTASEQAAVTAVAVVDRRTTATSGSRTASGDRPAAGEARRGPADPAVHRRGEAPRAVERPGPRHGAAPRGGNEPGLPSGRRGPEHGGPAQSGSAHGGPAHGGPAHGGPKGGPARP